MATKIIQSQSMNPSFAIVSNPIDPKELETRLFIHTINLFLPLGFQHRLEKPPKLS
nr:hypothetical protein [Leptospira biflexa]